jgi:uncharacterized membrane protein YoaK (UPF0700 family)
MTGLTHFGMIMAKAENAPSPTRAILVRDLLLIALTVSSGAVDAISYLCLDRTFSAFMTGNLVFLGLGLVRSNGPQVLPVLVALVGFALGSYVGAIMTRSQGPGLWTSPVSAALGLTAACQLLFLILWADVAGQPGSTEINLLLLLSSLAMGLQTAAIRSLNVKGIFTTAATFTLVAFMDDLAGSRPQDEGPRVAGVLAGLVLGAALGALCLLHILSYAPLLPLVITLAVAAAGAFALNGIGR